MITLSRKPNPTKGRALNTATVIHVCMREEKETENKCEGVQVYINERSQATSKKLTTKKMLQHFFNNSLINS